MKTEITLDPNTYSYIEIRRTPSDKIHPPVLKNIIVYQDSNGDISINYGNKMILDERDLNGNSEKEEE